MPVSFQTTKNTLSIVVGEEFGVVWEVVNKPVAGDTDEYGSETFLCRWSAIEHSHADEV